MALTEEQLDTKISAIDTQLDIMVASPDTGVDYHIGSKKVLKSQKVSWLTKLRAVYVTLRALIPYEAIKQFNIEIDEFGIDLSEYDNNI